MPSIPDFMPPPQHISSYRPLNPFGGGNQMPWVNVPPPPQQNPVVPPVEPEKPSLFNPPPEKPSWFYKNRYWIGTVASFLVLVLSNRRH